MTQKWRKAHESQTNLGGITVMRASHVETDSTVSTRTGHWPPPQGIGNNLSSLPSNSENFLINSFTLHYLNLFIYF